MSEAPPSPTRASGRAGPSPHCVVMYFYVHSADEEYWYTSTRGATEPKELTELYLECALVQAATLRLARADCDVRFVWNLRDPHNVAVLGSRGVRLVQAMEALGVEMAVAEFAHRFEHTEPLYGGSRYILDAIGAACATTPDNQVLWFTDLDVVWADAARTFAAAPPEGEVGALLMNYPADWQVMPGTTPRTVGEVGRELGDSLVPAPWVGGELIVGTPATLLRFLSACDALDDALGERPAELPAEEHLFSLVAALGHARFHDLTPVGRRVFTGWRTRAPQPANPATLGLWHLPFEKGLSFRRTANALLNGNHRQLARDLGDPKRLMRRFNVGRRSLRRGVRDDAYIAGHKVRTVWQGWRGA